MRMKVIKLLFYTENQTLNSKTTKETKTEHENIVWLFRKDYQRVSFHRRKNSKFVLGTPTRPRESVDWRQNENECMKEYTLTRVHPRNTNLQKTQPCLQYIERGWILF